MLTEPERELVAQEARQFASRLDEGPARETYRRLEQAAAETGQVDGELVQALEGLLGLGLSTGRIRALYGAHAEMAAAAAFRRTPAGRRLQQGCDEANRGLGALAGRVLYGLSVQARGPGIYLVSVEVAGARAVLQLDRDGVQLRSVEFGL